MSNNNPVKRAPTLSFLCADEPRDPKDPIHPHNRLFRNNDTYKAVGKSDRKRSEINQGLGDVVKTPTQTDKMLDKGGYLTATLQDNWKWIFLGGAIVVVYFVVTTKTPVRAPVYNNGLDTYFTKLLTNK